MHDESWCACGTPFTTEDTKVFSQRHVPQAPTKKDRFKRWSEAANVFVRATGRVLALQRDFPNGVPGFSSGHGIVGFQKDVNGPVFKDMDTIKDTINFSLDIGGLSGFGYFGSFLRILGYRFLIQRCNAGRGIGNFFDQRAVSPDE